MTANYVALTLKELLLNPEKFNADEIIGYISEKEAEALKNHRRIGAIWKQKENG